jgi:PAS domain S-box-containing protein
VTPATQPLDSTPPSFHGSGELSTLVRAYPWHTTPLGPIGGWPSALLDAVSLMLHSPFPFAIYWGESFTLLYNDSYRTLLGTKHPQALGQTGPEVWPEVWDHFGAHVRSALGGTSVSGRGEPFRILTDGRLEQRWFSFGLSPLFQGDQIAGVAVQVVEDTAAQRANEDLFRSREEFRTAMDAAGLGFWHYAPGSRIVITSGRMQKIYGVGETLTVEDSVQLLHPDDRERVVAHFQSVLAGTQSSDIEYRILRAGEQRWIRSKGHAIRPDNAPAHLFAVVEDVTERKLAEIALQQNEKLAAVGRLAASIAHEINNPLEAVTNLLYLAELSTTLEQARGYVQHAEQELRRVSLITNQTLRFHRQSTQPAPAFCHDLITDALSIYTGRLHTNRITVEKRKRAERPVRCLASEIRQVLANLIGNSLDSMPAGGRLLLRSREQHRHRPATATPGSSPTTAAQRHTPQHGLVLTVADTGTGMPLAVQKRALDAFYTTKGNAGTGLGLWISHEIVHRHGGTLRFRSSTTPGRSGTVFTLFLPYDA